MAALRLVFLSVLFAVFEASACPLIGGMVDFNCDGIHKVVILGDSIVKGVGDLENNNKGGYVLRLQKRFKKSTFINLGKPGYSSERLLREVKSKLTKRGKNAFKTGMQAPDIILIDAGRNDYFEELSPGTTVKNLELIVSYLKKYYSDRDEVVPVIEVATLLPTTRGYQRPFISDVNKLLLKFASDNLPVKLFFNQFSKTVISKDGIHPYSGGYKKIAQYLSRVLKGNVKKESLSLRPDRDKDGVYDKFEDELFGTDPTLADTDGDGFTDGQELFELKTDPLNPDEF